MKLAVAEGDYATQFMLSWFIDEQVQSEYEINCILLKLEMIGDDEAALLALDSEMEPAEDMGDFWNIKGDDTV
jgi:ferritin